MDSEINKSILTDKMNEQVDEVNNIFNEASRIFMNVTDMKDYSEKDLNELFMNNLSLITRLRTSLDLFEIEFDEVLLMKRKRNFNRMIKTIILNIINLILCITVSPLVSIFGSVLVIGNVINYSKESKKDEEDMKNILNSSRALVNRSKLICNNLDNNELFIKKRLKDVRNNNTIIEKVDVVKVANNIIQEYFETNSLPDNIDVEVLCMMKSILREKDSKEDDLIKLLDEAKRKSLEDSKTLILK